MKKITTVFFDAGNTFLSPCKSVGKIYAQLAKEKGYLFSSETIDAKIPDAWDKYFHIKSDRNFKCSDEILIRDWKQFVRDVLPGNMLEEDFKELFSHIYTRLGGAEFYTLAVGFEDTLHTLKKMGVHVGIISNWDSRLPGILKALNLYSLFDTTTISYEAGVEKPNTKIFKIACQRANVKPENAIIIGDSIAHDVEASESIGMTGILYNGKSLKLNWRGPTLHSWEQPDILLAFFRQQN
ncbi:HAD-IA family hydrolase [Desulfotignum phosphitoxidans]|uniref:HAD-superfamily hydrolase, subfamily IA, variant 1 n=1 Tax=Desulfotignum phosphitoxidans DSM 13687 TaxID=1286635 RepID=S0G7U7_9BACT|nr:HAD-IA family hydrolase [Desulfotignum phosphitoxidans]EMS81492.1 HAD-superfamily hydrolase, subfamily IA, variant 1 [Desulfotignum phosphitoxidans DSM 13687]